MSYLAMARAFEVKRKVERSQPDLALSRAYRKYWTTPESAPMETFTAIHVEIATLEAQLDPCKVIDILEMEARRFHRETGRCPFCRLVGPLQHEHEGHE